MFGVAICVLPGSVATPKLAIIDPAFSLVLQMDGAGSLCVHQSKASGIRKRAELVALQ
jgi:hypothetical protein